MVLHLPDSWWNWNLEMLVFEERGNRSTRRKNLSEQRREPTTNSTHIWHWRQDMNPGHIGGRGEQYFYPPMLAPFAYLNTLICLFLFRNIQHPDHVRDDNYYVWTFCRLISVRSLFWSNLKLLKGRQTPVTFRNMETWSVNLIIFEIFWSVDGRQADLIDVTTVFILMFSHP